MNIMNIVKMISVFFLSVLCAACSGGEKSVAYFQSHPKEFRADLKECQIKLIQEEQIPEGQPCQSVINVLRTQCAQSRFISSSCNNPINLLVSSIMIKNT